MKKIFFMLTLLVASVGAEAKYWKIGPGSVVGMDFASINAAMSSSIVNEGDTLYLDQYYNENSDQTVTKEVVIIGTGYDKSLTDEQVVATLTKGIILKANKILVKSVRLYSVQFYNEGCIIDRCYVSALSTNSATAGLNHVYSCYIYTGSNKNMIYGYSSEKPSKMDIQNCLIIQDYEFGHVIQDLTNSIIKNNTIISKTCSSSNYILSHIINSVISNNIILADRGSSYYNYDIPSAVYASGSGNSIEHNILSHTSAFTNFPTNKYGHGGSASTLFIRKGRYSDYYQLAMESGDNPAVNYAMDGGEVGCHGGMFGCPSGGRPQYIPYFTKVTVGSRSEDGKLPVSVTIKIQDE